MVFLWCVPGVPYSPRELFTLASYLADAGDLTLTS